MTHILLIEDDKDLSELIVLFLEKHDFTVSSFANVKQFEQYSGHTPDLIICDIMLPDGNGYDIFNKCSGHFNCPFIFLTALDSVQQQIKGLELGAHDYLVKPIAPELLLAKINAQLRHLAKTPQKQQISLDDQNLMLNYQGTLIALNQDELKLMQTLLNAQPKAVARDVLFSVILERPYDGLDRSVDLKISRFRKKLSQAGVADFDVKAVRNQGYAIRWQSA